MAIGEILQICLKMLQFYCGCLDFIRIDHIEKLKFEIIEM